MPYSVCVFCGARPGKNDAFVAAAEVLGRGLAKHNMRLVYGAGDVGIMGTVARAAQTGGAQTFGVIPTHLVELEIGKKDLDSFVITETMHERKKVMFMNADAVVLMPGGAGSLEEFFEVLTWAQLGQHTKPIIVANIEGYWDPLLALIDNVVDQGFADASLNGLFAVKSSVEDVLAALATAKS